MPCPCAAGRSSEGAPVVNTFNCTHCGQVVFFENVRCEHCGSPLGFLPDARALVAFEIQADSSWLPLGRADGRVWHPCHNYAVENVCNWMVAADDANANADSLCECCRHTEVIPPLGKPENKRYWALLESAKRRLFYTLSGLGLAVPSRSEDPARGLAFHFLEEADAAHAVLTGHDSGLITLNIAEADDAQREARRTALGEPYRTLLGHFRHEIGHFYWDRLVAGGGWLAPFRALFGDESADYGAAMQRHYQAGPPADWAATCISAYAAMHPWEDWAETWAHYLHVVDALDTARHWGFALHADGDADKPADIHRLDPAGMPFRQVLLERWLPLAQFLNSMNRSLGQRDGYPFLLANPVVDKLEFVHRVVESARGMDWRQWPPMPPMPPGPAPA